METGLIFDIQRFCLHDGPGIRTTVFLKGCSLRCRWCHNPEGLTQRVTVGFKSKKCVGCGRCFKACSLHTLTETGEHRIDFERCTGSGRCVNVCPARALFLSGWRVDAEELIEQVMRDKAFYGREGGITFSGGEPLLQASFVRECAGLAKGRGLTVAVDTCGNVPFEAFERVMPRVDLFLYDIKAASGELHKQATGSDNGRILANLRRLDAVGARLWIRIPLIHGVNDSPQEIESIAGIIGSLRRVERITPIPYHDLGQSKYGELGMKSAMTEAFRISDERMREIREDLGRILGHKRVN